jgi:hypothetical protein
MPSVLHLDPVLRAARLIEPVTVFAHQAFQPHLADGAEHVGPDLALFERSHEDTVRVSARFVFRIESGSPRKSSRTYADRTQVNIEVYNLSRVRR